jgi:hypothetical protein
LAHPSEAGVLLDAGQDFLGGEPVRERGLCRPDGSERLGGTGSHTDDGDTGARLDVIERGVKHPEALIRV